jgi:hypothetical protein
MIEFAFDGVFTKVKSNAKTIKRAIGEIIMAPT